MKLAVDRDHLKAALARVKPAVPRRSQIAVLSGVHIDPTTATLTATNLDLTIATELDTDGAGQPIVVPHERLAALVARCPDGTIDLEADAEQLTITAGRVTAHLRLLPVDEWPKLPTVAGEPIKLGAGDWAGICLVQHARSHDFSRPSITLCEIHDGDATCTDSYRLATRSGIDPALDVLLPGHLIDAVAGAGATEPTLTVADRWLHMTDGVATTWSAVRPDGSYPTWRTLMPADPPVRFTVDREALIEAVAAVSAIGIDVETSRDALMVHLDIGANHATITARHRELGEVVVDLEVSDIEGIDRAGLAVTFNAAYLTQALRQLAMSAVRFEGTDPLKPWIMAEAAVRLLMMPVRV